MHKVVDALYCRAVGADGVQDEAEEMPDIKRQKADDEHSHVCRHNVDSFPGRHFIATVVSLLPAELCNDLYGAVTQDEQRYEKSRNNGTQCDHRGCHRRFFKAKIIFSSVLKAFNERSLTDDDYPEDSRGKSCLQWRPECLGSQRVLDCKVPVSSNEGDDADAHEAVCEIATFQNQAPAIHLQLLELGQSFERQGEEQQAVSHSQVDHVHSGFCPFAKFLTEHAQRQPIQHDAQNQNWDVNTQLEN